MNKVEELTKILARLSAGSDAEKIKIDNKELLATIKSKDISLACMNLLESGMFVSDFCKLCKNSLQIIGDPVSILFKETGNHILKKIFSQHREILATLNQLELLNIEIKTAADVDHSSDAYKKFLLTHEQLSQLCKHCEFEHNVILPEIAEAGFVEIARLIKYQHIDIRQCQAGLSELAKGFYPEPADFKNKLNATTQSIVQFCRMHIAVEEAILYPIAAEVIQNQATWDKFLVFFDQYRNSA